MWRAALVCQFALLSLLVLSAGTVVGAGSKKQVIFTQIAHRHGARTPLVSKNSSVVCGDAGCGQLNIAGKHMLEQVGSWARDRYINNSDPSLSFMSSLTSYNPNVIASRSTNVARTLQSADGFLRGLFPNLQEFYPVISTVDFWTDELLLVDALPAFHLPGVEDIMVYRKRLEPLVLAAVTKEQLQTIGVELSLEGVCNVENFDVSDCALQLQDIIAAYNSDRLHSDSTTPYLSQFPVAWSLRDTFMTFRKQWNSMLFPYNTSSEMDLKRGALGQNLAQEIIQSMKDKVLDPNSWRSSFFLKEWSAHDTTMMPLCATLGQESMMLPLFGQSYFFELLNDTSVTATKEDPLKPYSVRVIYGHPIQEPGPHTFQHKPFPLTCIAANGTNYTTMEDCPLEDLHRFINRSLPQSPAGLCYVEKSLLDRLNCQPTNSTPPSPSGLCTFYRDHCRSIACGPDHFLNTSNYACHPVVSGLRVATAAIMTVAATAAGMIIGAIVMKLASRRSGGRGGYDNIQAGSKNA